ncbi:MAG: hypothetical protein CMO55_13170 [Verrucomicrobiales bacterium]|nr:hypothetical protein [Verrucomicrobiales bacterium]
MKHIALTISASLALISPTWAADEGAGKPGRGKGDGSFFKQLDTNDDKSISKEEAGERWERMSRLDKDNDGMISPQELMAGRPGGGKGKGPGGPKGNPGELFQRADKNSDGKLTEDELPAEVWSRISRLDSDKDGAVTKEEVAAGRPEGRPGSAEGPGKGKGKGADFLKRADKNGDGDISKDEVPEQAWERMSRMDKDNDGVLTKEEMAAGFAAMRGMRGEGGKGPGGRAGATSGGPVAIFSRYDEDKDGKLAESEVPGEMWSKLRKADTDADGLVSKSELEKVYGEMRKYSAPPEKKRPEMEKSESDSDTKA